MVSSENTHINKLHGLNRLHLGMHVYITTYMHTIRINKKETTNLNESGEVCMGEFEERNRKGERL